MSARVTRGVPVQWIMWAVRRVGNRLGCMMRIIISGCAGLGLRRSIISVYVRIRMCMIVLIIWRLVRIAIVSRISFRLSTTNMGGFAISATRGVYVIRRAVCFARRVSIDRSIRSRVCANFPMLSSKASASVCSHSTCTRTPTTSRSAAAYPSTTTPGTSGTAPQTSATSARCPATAMPAAA